MERLTTNKDVSEMSMIELAYNSCYAKDNKARYRDYDTDIDARELIKKLLDKFADISIEFTCDDDFDDFILDYAQYGTDNILGLIAIFYKNLWAMADLRERLAEYEDIGLLPEQIIEVDKLYAEKCKELSELHKSCSSSLKLPCKVGDTVYTNISIQGWYFRKENRPYKAKVVFIGINGVENFINVDFGNGRMLRFNFSDIGKTVFLTQEEAEAALRKTNETEGGKKNNDCLGG